MTTVIKIMKKFNVKNVKFYPLLQKLMPVQGTGAHPVFGRSATGSECLTMATGAILKL
jgi:hypothetical protein